MVGNSKLHCAALSLVPTSKMLVNCCVVLGLGWKNQILPGLNYPNIEISFLKCNRWWTKQCIALSLTCIDADGVNSDWFGLVWSGVCRWRLKTHILLRVILAEGYPLLNLFFLQKKTIFKYSLKIWAFKVCLMPFLGKWTLSRICFTESWTHG